jgi:hypothetical protein
VATNTKSEFLKKLEEARKIDVPHRCHKTPSNFVGSAQFYCESEDCNVREVDISIKEYCANIDSDPKCPFCGKKLKFHWVRGLRG